MTDDPTYDRPAVLEALDRLDVGTAPIGAIVAVSHRHKRRRTMYASVAAVAVLIAGVSVATAGTSNDTRGDSSRIDAADITDTAPFPDPPSGEKWVGMNGVVVAVPTEWPVSESPCGTGAPNEVIDARRGATVDCSYDSSKVETQVRFTTLDEAPQPGDEGVCGTSVGGLCVGGSTFENQDFAFVVHARGPDALDQVEGILASAMVLPDGWTTIPFGEGASLEGRINQLESAGFEVNVTDAEGIDRFAIAVTPAIGAPVEEGSVVELAPLTDNQPLPTEAPTAAPPTGGVSGAGCSGVEVTDTTATDSELVVTLMNDGADSCDLIGLEVAVTLGPFDLRDQARLSDFAASSTELSAGGTAVLRLETYPGCQFAEAELTFSLNDDTSLVTLHPGEAGNECIEPAPQLQLSAVEVLGGAEPADTEATDLGGAWNVQALVGREGQSLLSGPNADGLSIEFDNGEMNGSSGCNSVFGTYVQSGPDNEDVTFPSNELGSSAVGCAEPPLLERLQDVRHVSGEGDTRYLHAENWMIVVELRRIP